jgi:hypothetical protein
MMFGWVLYLCMQSTKSGGRRDLRRQLNLLFDSLGGKATWQVTIALWFSDRAAFITHCKEELCSHSELSKSWV